jgi:hypothetical protein
MEHVPDPYQAHGEIYRVLRAGGRHIFTVPYYASEYQDEKRAVIEGQGQIQWLKPPIYHEDPLRPEGALVYTIFGLEMLVRLAEIGFRTRMHHLYQPWRGILGANGLVFESVKIA